MIGMLSVPWIAFSPVKKLKPLDGYTIVGAGLPV